MGKYLWRKHSYVRVEDDHPGCVWTVFHMLNYHPWHNVRKMLPYKKHKHHGKTSTSKGILLEEEKDIISITHELEEDSIMKYSASVNSNASRNGSTSKRSIKARIRALMIDKNSSTKSNFSIDEPKIQGQEGKYEDYDKEAPTLMALLKANPKLLRSVSRVDNSSDTSNNSVWSHQSVDSNNIMKGKTNNSKKKDEFVGVLELFNVDQDLFTKILQDTSPKKPRLVKSGTFPARNSANLGTTPSKVEHKFKETWPNVHELRKAKSQGIVRSSSLTESLGKFGYLFDTSSNKAIKKHLSKSLKLANEKEYGLWGDLQGRRSFKERLDLRENGSYPFTMSEPLSRASSENDKIRAEVRLLRLESSKDSENLVESETTTNLCGSIEVGNEEDIMQATLPLSLENREIDSWNSVESQSEEIISWYSFEEEQICQETIDEVQSQEKEIQITKIPISEESQSMPNTTSTSSRKRESTQDSIDQISIDYYNQDLEYVKYVLDIACLTTLEHPHSQPEPLEPALFDGIEVCCPFEPKTLNKDTKFSMSSSHRRVLFDLINEALLHIHENSYKNYPKALSFCCKVPNMRTKNIGIVEQVWKLVEEWLSWKPELDPSLDLAVANDLSRDKNGWVNLQMDIESLALELEDWIFDDLLDEFDEFFG